MSDLNGMIQDEGFGDVAEVMSKSLSKARVRKQMKTLNIFVQRKLRIF